MCELVTGSTLEDWVVPAPPLLTACDFCVGGDESEVEGVEVARSRSLLYVDDLSEAGSGDGLQERFD